MKDVILSSIEEAIEDFREGKFVIVVDDEDRENEGDFIIAANGKLVGRLHELTRILYATGVGNEVKLTVIRGARELIIPIRLYDRLTE